MPGRPHTHDVDDIRWLLGAQAAEFLLLCADDGPGPSTSLVAKLRARLPASRVHLVLEQTDLRQRARKKFARASQMFFERTALEQATDEVLANYKARQFGPGTVADLCCGIGGDLIGLAKDRHVVGFERDQILAMIALRNAKTYDRQNVEVHSDDATQVPVDAFATWHLDPDRRPSGRRTTHVELHEPDLPQINALLARNQNAGIKLAPATQVPDEWLDRAELEWLGHRRECQQLFAKFGSLALRPGRHATVLQEGEPVTISGNGSAPSPPVGPVKAFVYDPHPAIIAAQLVDALCAQWSLTRLSRRIAYLTSDTLIVHAALTVFRVIEWLPADVKRVRRVLQAHEIGRVEIKKRNTRHDPTLVARQLAGPGDKCGVVLLAGLPRQTLAIVAERVAERIA